VTFPAPGGPILNLHPSPANKTRTTLNAKQTKPVLLGRSGFVFSEKTGRGWKITSGEKGQGGGGCGKKKKPGKNNGVGGFGGGENKNNYHPGVFFFGRTLYTIFFTGPPQLFFFFSLPPGPPQATGDQNKIKGAGQKFCFFFFASGRLFPRGNPGPVFWGAGAGEKQRGRGGGPPPTPPHPPKKTIKKNPRGGEKTTPRGFFFGRGPCPGAEPEATTKKIPREPKKKPKGGGGGDREWGVFPRGGGGGENRVRQPPQKVFWKKGVGGIWGGGTRPNGSAQGFFCFWGNRGKRGPPPFCPLARRLTINPTWGGGGGDHSPPVRGGWGGGNPPPAPFSGGARPLRWGGGGGKPPKRGGGGGGGADHEDPHTPPPPQPPHTNPPGGFFLFLAPPGARHRGGPSFCFWCLPRRTHKKKQRPGTRGGEKRGKKNKTYRCFCPPRGGGGPGGVGLFYGGEKNISVLFRGGPPGGGMRKKNRAGLGRGGETRRGQRGGGARGFFFVFFGGPRFGRGGGTNHSGGGRGGFRFWGPGPGSLWGGGGGGGAPRCPAHNGPPRGGGGGGPGGVPFFFAGGVLLSPASFSNPGGPGPHPPQKQNLAALVGVSAFGPLFRGRLETKEHRGGVLFFGGPRRGPHPHGRFKKTYLGGKISPRFPRAAIFSHQKKTPLWPIKSKKIPPKPVGRGEGRLSRRGEHPYKGGTTGGRLTGGGREQNK